MSAMIEIRWHGEADKSHTTVNLSQAPSPKGSRPGIPSFGPGKTGRPGAAFNRVDEKQIKIRSGIYKPDVVVVLDPTLIGLVNVTDGLKDGGVLIVNTAKTPEEIRKSTGFRGAVATVDATKIAREELGVPITNTTMLGAVIKAVSPVKVESLTDLLKHRFGRLAQRNMTALKRAFTELNILKAA
jgi:pyruvate ferredoxin oxidoreductase gamma subunit